MLRPIAATSRPDAATMEAFRRRSGLAVVCIVALLAPSTCFLKLSLPITLRMPVGSEEEHETQSHSVNAAPIEQRRTSASRHLSRPSSAAQAEQKPGRPAARPHSDRGHRHANGLCAPLRC